MPDDVATRLRAAGCVFAEDEARLLRAAARDDPDLERMVTRRAGGTPLEQLLGWAEFCGLRVVVTPGVFVPRRRTEWVAERAIMHAPENAVVVDLCCGSGAIAAAVAARRPDAEVHAADVDPAAVACARQNLPSERVHEGDLYDALPRPLAGRVDVLAVNAPYVPSDAIALMPPEARDHEPRVALDGGADGLALHRRVAAGAPGWLAPGGWLLIETSGPQAEETARLVADAGLRAAIRSDESRDATLVEGRAS
jgi:release factor glutamine methyltransferase